LNDFRRRCRVRGSVEPLSRRLVLDAQAEGFEGKLDFVGHDDALSYYVPDVNFNKLFHCVYALSYHLVLATKYRRKRITPPMLTRLREITEQRCRDWPERWSSLTVSRIIHILMSLPPHLDLSRFINNLKTTSSRLIRRDFSDHLKRVYRKPVFWSRSYHHLVRRRLSIIKQYIEQQVRLEPGRLSRPAKRKRSGWSTRRRTGRN
jgi:putative transposase